MRQTISEYQNEYYENEGYVFFENVEAAAKEMSKNRRMDIKMVIEGIENDTNCDCVVLNDGSVAVHPKSKMLIPEEKLEEMYYKMQRGEITKLKYYLYAKNMTVAALAVAADLNKRTLDEYVSGRRELKTIQLDKGLKIAEVLKCDIHDLI